MQSPTSSFEIPVFKKENHWEATCSADPSNEISNLPPT